MEANYFVAGAAVVAFVAFIVYKVRAAKKLRDSRPTGSGGGLPKNGGGGRETQVEK